jgi:hypothetical protein
MLLLVKNKAPDEWFVKGNANIPPGKNKKAYVRKPGLWFDKKVCCAKTIN